MEFDLSKPIEIADNVFWVGYVVPNDPFQCHVYLIRNGKESILIDPGSEITFPVVLEKIFKVTPLKNVKYIIMHHQDPDITGCYSILETLFPDKEERFIVTHWRTKTLLKHYNWKTPFYLIDEHDFKLKAGERELEFVFTPYAHFPGAFCTYDKKTETLFSSDIFGAISEKFFLFAEDTEEYYQGVELFHKHYMPSSSILNYALDRIEEKNPKLIAPQHGSIIREDMIKPVIERLRKLDCGLFLFDEKPADIRLLDKIDETLKKLFRTIISSTDFRVTVKKLYETIKEEVPSLEKIIIFGKTSKRKKYLEIEIGEGFFSEGMCSSAPNLKGFSFKEVLETDEGKVGSLYIYAGKLSKRERDYLRILFNHIRYPLAASFERKVLEEEKEELEKKVTTDPLTGLSNREYFKDFLSETIATAREHGFPVSLAMIDIDFFKKINDTYGHLIGDCVLQQLARILKKNFRTTDCVARYGGEEFAIVMPYAPLNKACRKLEGLRKQVEEFTFCKKEGLNLKVTISIGVYEYKKGMSVKELIEKADENLYAAKRSGRNRVVCDE